MPSRCAPSAARELAARHGGVTGAQLAFSIQSIPVGGRRILRNHRPEVVRDISHNEQQRTNRRDGVHGQAIYGLCGDTLANFSDRVDLLIIGSRGYGPLGRPVHSSTPNHPLRTAPCPLLILPRAAKADEPSPRRADADRLKTAGAQS